MKSEPPGWDDADNLRRLGNPATLNAQVRSLAYPDQENDVEKPLFPSAE